MLFSAVGHNFHPPHCQPPFLRESLQKELISLRKKLRQAGKLLKKENLRTMIIDLAESKYHIRIRKTPVPSNQNIVSVGLYRRKFGEKFTIGREQYCSNKYVEILESKSIQISMIQTGNP